MTTSRFSWRSFLFVVTAVLFSHGLIIAAPITTLATDGVIDYVIVLPATASEVEKTAATQLQESLAAVTGATFPIVTAANGEAVPARAIVLSSDASLPDDAIVIETDGETLRLSGHPQRGVLYAVFTFLEDHVGVRWWSAEQTFTPHKPTLTVPPLAIRYAPQMIYRETYYLQPSVDGAFAARMKCNGIFNPIPAAWGGVHEFSIGDHSFFPLVPPSKYFAAHPEWYSEIDGKRQSGYSQLCLTNTEMRDELIKNAKVLIREHPNARFICISQNDCFGGHYNYCQCAECRKVLAEEGAESGVLIRFVNAVAEEIEKEFPDVFVMTLAFQYTCKPPLKVKPRDNVVIRFCTQQASFIQPLTGEQNATIKEEVEGWSRISKHMFVWDYLANFSGYMVPHPNWGVLGANIRFFADNNALGMFAQGDSYSAVGDFVRMRNWVVSHMMWDPSLDGNALIDEFLDGAYSPAVGRIFRRYLDTLRETAERSGARLSCYIDPNVINWIDLDSLNTATMLMNEAYAVAVREEASDPQRYAGLAEKVKRERLPLDHVWLLNYATLHAQARLSGKPFLGPTDLKAAAEAWVATCRKHDPTALYEGMDVAGFELYASGLLAKCQEKGDVREASPPEFCRDLPVTSWLDFQENDFDFTQRGTLVDVVDDAAASNGRAARMPGNHTEWATVLAIPAVIAQQLHAATESVAQGGTDATPCRVYAFVRCDTTVDLSNAVASAKPAMAVGIYDGQARKDVAYKVLTIAETAGSDYHLIDLGTLPFTMITATLHFWAAPVNRPDAVMAVFVDRVVIVRQ